MTTQETKRVFPESTAATLQHTFKQHLEESLGEFYDTMCTLFAYNVLTESTNDLAEEPLNLDKFMTLDELLETRFTLDFANEADVLLTEEVEDSFLTLLSWKEQFKDTINAYVKDTFTDMFQKGATNLLQVHLSKAELKDEEKVFVLIEELTGVVGKSFFQACSEDLQTIFFGGNPRSTFERGKSQAENLIKESDLLLTNMGDELLELSLSLNNTNALWDKVNKMYLHKYKQNLPLGKVTDETYERYLKCILKDLFVHNVDVKDVRQLAHFGSRFAPEVMQKVLLFTYN